MIQRDKNETNIFEKILFNNSYVKYLWNMLWMIFIFIHKIIERSTNLYYQFYN